LIGAVDVDSVFNLISSIFIHPLEVVSNGAQETTCTFTGSGIKFAVEQAGCVQARAFLQSDLFDVRGCFSCEKLGCDEEARTAHLGQDYQCTTDDADLCEFRVNFNVFLVRPPGYVYFLFGLIKLLIHICLHLRGHRGLRLSGFRQRKQAA
jgi:hypothetical protein